MKEKFYAFCCKFFTLAALFSLTLSMSAGVDPDMYEWHKISSTITQDELETATALEKDLAMALLSANHDLPNGAYILYEKNVGGVTGVYNLTNVAGGVMDNLTVSFLPMMIASGLNAYYVIEKSTATNDFTKIGGTADLVEGGKYLIAYGESSTATYNVMNEVNANNQGKTKTMEVTDDVAEESVVTASGAMVLTLVKNGDNWAFQTPDGKYLTYTKGSTSNKLYLSTNLDDNSSWTITFDIKGGAVIKSVGTPTRTLQYNANNDNPIIACYTSAQKAPFLFKQGEVKTKPTPFVTPEFKSVAEFNAYKQPTAVKLVMNEWTITSFDGKNLYLTDNGTDVLLIYGNDIPENWKVNGKVSGTIEGDCVYYEKQEVWEVKNVKSWDGVNYTAPEAGEVIELTFNNAQMVDNCEVGGWWQVQAVTEDEMWYITLSPMSATTVEGTYKVSDMDLEFSFIEKEGDSTIVYELTDGTITVTGNEDGTYQILATVDACNTEDNTDLVTFNITVNTGVFDPYSYDMNVDIEKNYTTEDNINWLSDDGLVNLMVDAADDSDEMVICFACESDESGKAPIGEYPINDSYEAPSVVASMGCDEDGNVYPSFYATVDGIYLNDIWFIVSGTVKVEANKITVNATNSKGKKVNITVDLGTTGIEKATSDYSRVNDLYNLHGQKVNKNHKGIVIRQGNKTLVK